jgi:hypothetical protein
MNRDLDSVFRFISARWAEQSKHDDYSSIIDSSIASLLLARSWRGLDGAGEAERASLTSLYFSIGKILPEITAAASVGRTDQACSFCGSKPPEVRIGAGPDAFICNECVDTFSKIFHDPVGSK